MKVNDWRIIGLIIGLFYGGAFAPMLEFIMSMLLAIGVVQILLPKQQILTGVFGGILVGLATGYGIREYVF
jgi:hypothetical protein